MKNNFIFIIIILITVLLSAQELPLKQSAAERIKEIIVEFGIEQAIEEFSVVSSDTSRYYSSESEFNLTGYQLIDLGKLTESLELFKMNIQLFPHSANVYDSIAEGYLYAGDKDKALEYYAKIKEIDPENLNGERMIENIAAEFELRQQIKLAIFHDAAKYGNLTLVQNWITSCPENLNKTSKDGNSALHLAVYNGHTEVVKYLLSRQAEVNTRNLLGETPYNLAEKNDLNEIMQLLTSNGADTAPQVFPILKGNYLGQQEPGLEPEIFAPGIVSTHRKIYGNIAFSPDQTIACWTPNDGSELNYTGGLIISKFQDGKWGAPKDIRFLDENYGHRSPFFSSDSKKLYFQGYLRSNQDWDQFEHFYYVNRQDDGWSEPVLLDSIFNKYGIHWQFSLDKYNNLYFGGKLRGDENSAGIYYSEHNGGEYLEPELIFSKQELPEHILAPAISPDGEYLVFIRLYPRGSTCPRFFSMFVSFKQEDNTWSEPADVGELLKMDSNQARVSWDGKYIFYVGNDGNSYWVSSDILEQFK